MAQGRRVERVASLIRREVSELLVAGIKDDRVAQGMVSITRVDVAGDLQHCRIHVSIYGSDVEREQALAGLQSAAGYVKGELSRRLKLRRTPEVVFRLDRGLEQGTSVLGLLNRLEEERLAKAGLDGAEATTADAATPRSTGLDQGGLD
jgi:ribosome-binding factor A